MKSFNKTLQTGVCVILAAGMLAGCGEKSSEQTNPKESETSQELSAWEESEVSDGSQLEMEAQIGQLDEIPVALYEQGWIAVRNGKAGLIGTDGQWKVPAEYTNAIMNAEMDVVDNVRNILPITGFVNFQEEKPSVLVSPDSIEEGTYPAGGGANPNVFSLDSEGEIILKNMTEEYDSSSQFYREQIPPQAVTVYSESGYDTTSPYWIWSPQTGKIDGPYEYNANPSFGIAHSGGIVQLRAAFNVNIPVSGPYSAMQPDGTYTLCTPDGSTVRSGFEEVSFPAPNTAAGKIGHTVWVYDQNLDILFKGNVDQASVPVGDRILIEKDGDWFLAKFDPSAQFE